ncbi:hypothetical protein [Magnetospirillum sp. SS-4]|uniref:hypothetical protein n=1 Tax=Magnetospirillum sp. SS-4 TaxID=2681465 RepID=UPI0015733A79|nr:hypothetical protein [Magnetospirillum sp. SS-4]
MSELSQDMAGGGSSLSSPAKEKAAKPRSWLGGAARALGLGGSEAESASRQGGFDFIALHRSLASLERKSAAGE